MKRSIKIVMFAQFLLLLNSLYAANTTIVAADARSVMIQPDGNVLAAGVLNDLSSGIEFGLTRYLQANGAFDDLFGPDGNGIVGTAIGTRAEANDAVLQADGKIVLSGFISDIDGITKITTARYNSDGTLDTAGFGTGGNGIVTTQVGDGSQTTGLDIQASNQKIVATGTGVFNGQLKAVLIRYETDGSLDAGFGVGGIVTTVVGYHTGATELAIQADEKIVICGFAIIDNVRQIMLTRYNTDGSLDSSYGTGGSVTTIVGGSSEAFNVVIDASGNAVIAGVSDNTFLVARYTSSGVLDTTFGDNGIAITPIGAISCAFALAVQADGKIVAGGTSDSIFAVARYTTVGALDLLNFGTNGIVTTLIEGSDVAKAIAIATDGSLIVAGIAGSDFAVARYNTAGVLDHSWGLNGIVSLPGGSVSLASIISDRKPSGTDGGTFLSGSWVTRDLNTISTVSSNITLSSNQFILQPGLYEIAATSPAHMVDGNKIRLQNITNNQTVALGSAARSSSTVGSATSLSYLDAIIALTVATTFEIQHMCATSRSNDGFGVATGLGDPEIYTTVKVTQR